MTISSILSIIRTHSVAKVSALSVTRDGYTTLSSSIFIILLLLIFRPSNLCPWICLFLNSVTKTIGSSPAFSANVYGINSNDSPYCLTQ